MKAGLIITSLDGSKYTHELITWAKSTHTIEISCLILLEQNKQIHPTLNISEKIASLLSKLLFKIEEIYLKKFSIYKDHNKHFNLRNLIPILLPSTEKQKIKELNLDVLIQCCNDDTSNPSLSPLARLGILKIIYGNYLFIQNGLAGFWESFYKKPKTLFSIQQLTNQPPKTIVRGAFRTHKSLMMNQAHLYYKAHTHLKNILTQLSKDSVIYKKDLPLEAEKIRTINSSDLIEYFFKLLSRFLSTKFRLYLNKLDERWSLFFYFGNWKEIMFHQIITPDVPRGRFWADPFLYEKDQKNYCFFEDYIYSLKRGVISVLEIKDGQTIDLGVVLNESFHLSFPFLFEFNGQIYMCPESCATKQIRIYRCEDFPKKWKLERVIMDQISAVDSLLFMYEEKWWMFTTIDHSGTGDYSELYLYSASSPLSQNWHPHPQNPIVIDSDGGRNGGLIFENGTFFRVSQKQGFDTYGEGILIYKILQLTDTQYSEELIKKIDPLYKKKFKGTHHLSTTGKITVFDHKK